MRLPKSAPWHRRQSAIDPPSSIRDGGFCVSPPSSDQSVSRTAKRPPQAGNHGSGTAGDGGC
jgi:hypothetical protein